MVMSDLEIVLHICLIRTSLPYLWLTIALILLLLRYETSKLGDLKTTQINLKFVPTYRTLKFQVVSRSTDYRIKPSISHHFGYTKGIDFPLLLIPAFFKIRLISSWHLPFVAIWAVSSSLFFIFMSAVTASKTLTTSSYT